MNLKELICFSLLFILSCNVCMQAQSYTKLWKQVEELEKKDLPQSVISQVEVIYQKAYREKNTPEMIKAWIYRKDYRSGISPDSFYVDVNGLEKWVETTQKPQDKAILHSMLGEIYGDYISRNYYSLVNPVFLPGVELNAPEWTADTLFKKTLVHFLSSLENKELLARTSTKDYLPAIVQREGSNYYNHDLLHMLALRAVHSLEQSIYFADQYYKQTPKNENISYWNLSEFLRISVAISSDIDYKAQILLIFQDVLRYYQQTNRLSALVITELERLEFIKNYLYNGTPNSITDLTKSPYYQELSNLKTVYRELDAGIEVYIKMVEFAQANNQLVEALRLAEEGLRLYPQKTVANNRLLEKKKAILNPELTANFPKTAYPDKELAIQVGFRNIAELQIDFYKVNLSPTSSLLERFSDESFITSYTTHLTAHSYLLEPAPDYQHKDTTLLLKAPEEGIYLIGIKTGDKSQYSLLYVTRMQIISQQLTDNQIECVVVDAMTGHPVGGAELNIYTRERNNDYVMYKSFVTNQEGIVSWQGERGTFFVNAVKNEDRFMQPVYLSTGKYAQRVDNNSELEVTQLFTDRSIYRPGQTVYVGGVVYKQQKDSTEVVSQKTVKVELYDANNRMVSEKEVLTIEFGSFSTEFILPVAGLTGTFRIVSQNGSSYIRVEEYKRPGFAINFIPLEGSYAVGDSVELKGMVKRFSGAPLQNRVINYTVTRQTPFYFRQPYSSTPLYSGEVVTSETGDFVIPVYLEAPENIRALIYWYYNYKIEVTTTDEAGETQRNTYTISTGSNSLVLDSNLPDMVMKEKIDSITITARNLDQQPVDVKGSYTIYRLNEKGEIEMKAIEGAFVANSFLETERLKQLPSGSYRLTLSALDNQGRTVVYEKDFILYALNDTRPPVKRMDWFHQLDNEFNEETPATILFGTSGEDVWVLYDVFAGNRRLESRWLQLSDTIVRFEYPYREEYGDGILVKFIYMKDGQLYQNQAQIEKTRPKKELKMVWEVFRDKLMPGEKEEWKLKVEYPDGSPADAEIMATLYDSSLDQFQKHDWNMSVNFARAIPYSYWDVLTNGYSYINYTGNQGLTGISSLIYDDLIRSTLNDSSSGFSPFMLTRGGVNQMAMVSKSAGADRAMDDSTEMAVTYSYEQSGDRVEVKPQNSSSLQEGLQIRENLAETAFFYPALRTDKEGRVTLSFTLPESLTEWNFIGLSHTRKMDYGKLTGKTVATKDFMVAPNMPRFVRVGDKSTIAANIINLTARNLTGKVRMELLDAETEKIYRIQEKEYTVLAGKTAGVTFDVTIEEENIALFICRIVATGEGFSDGEQNYLPVLTNKVNITETVPFTLTGATIREYDVDTLFNRNSATAVNRVLTVEYTGAPAWYAVQALPVLSNPLNDNAISWATAYYSNNVAAYIVNANPRIKTFFETWKVQNQPESLWSNLQKNQELKNILLEETPWLLEAMDEAEQNQRLALLFDLNNLNYNNALVTRKLMDLQLPNGAWSWYKGMKGDRYITQQVVETLVRMRVLTGVNFDAEVQQMYDKAFNYLHGVVLDEYEAILKNKDKDQSARIAEITVHYLYLCALAEVSLPEKNQEANRYFIGQLPEQSKDFSIYGKALVATICYKNGQLEQAADFMRSIREYSVETKDGALTFDTPGLNYSWYNYRIPTQVAVIEAAELVTQDQEFVERLKIWLLQQKQTQAWSNPVASVNAVYALLLRGNNVLDVNSKATIKIGNEVIDTDNSLIPGMGYIKESYRDLKENIKVITINKEDQNLSWGAIYAQYQELADKVYPSDPQGFSVRKQFLVERRSEGEVEVIPIEENTSLKVGDKVVASLIIIADRDFDFVHLKDQRAACLEPSATLSGYKYQGGIGYYQAIKDASDDFFFDHLRKGTYILEQSYFVVRSGEYSSGIALLQSMYAPEFSTFSGARRLVVD